MAAALAEATDDELISLAIEAFAGVDEGNRRAWAAVETRIAERRVEVLARLAARHRSRDSSQT
jgi:PhoPQ-activated pathogenicity-related protein